MKISVALCTFNGEMHLSSQLESIGLQERLPDEILISDDRSTDSTLIIAEAFKGKTQIPVFILVNQHNLGSSRNFEQCIRKCAGDLIVLSDQDDVWRPNKLRIIEAVFEARKDITLAFSNAGLIGEMGECLEGSLWQRVSFGRAQQHLFDEERGYEILAKGNVVTGATVAFHASVLDYIFPIPDIGTRLHDHWIALIASCVGKIGLIQEPLVDYRCHDKQQVGIPGNVVAKPLIRPIRQHNEYTDQIKFAEHILNRIQVNNRYPICRDAFSWIEGWQAHLETRRSLSSVNRRRIRSVAIELLLRRYHIYSNGWRSALRDILPHRPIRHEALIHPSS